MNSLWFGLSLSMMQIPGPRKVALFIPSYVWQLRAGIGNFLAPPMLWDTINYERTPAGFDLAKNWEPDGLIGMLGCKGWNQRARSFSAPVVNIHGGSRLDGVAQVGYDHRAVGRMAAEHLMSLGFTEFACIGFPDQSATEDLRLMEFIDTVGANRVDVYSHEAKPVQTPKIRGHLIHPDDDRLHAWVHSLRKPCAVFACGDMLGSRVLQACQHLDIAVPENVAVLGVGDLAEFCFNAAIGLSSIALPWERIGYNAAAVLNRALLGAPLPEHPLLFEPVGVTVRRSSDTLSIPDRAVAEALRFIRAHACERISVPDILGKIPIGRRGLERKFRQLLHRSPHEEIMRVRLERVRHYLINTSDTIESIAADCGFGSAPRMSADFKRRFGSSPGEYRKQFRNAG